MEDCRDDTDIYVMSQRKGCRLPTNQRARKYSNSNSNSDDVSSDILNLQITIPGDSD